jgi:hypothetical protein
MKKVLWIILSFLFFVFVLVSLSNIVRWYKWYVDKRKLSFVVDIDFFVLTNNNVEEVISQLNKIGVNLFAIDVENFLLLKDRLFDNNKFILKINNQKIYDVKKLRRLLIKIRTNFFL